jgi:thymidine kinase
MMMDILSWSMTYGGGKAATMVLRVDEKGYVVREGNQIQVGGNDSYISVCRNHFTLGKTHRNYPG